MKHLLLGGADSNALPSNDHRRSLQRTAAAVRQHEARVRSDAMLVFSRSEDSAWHTQGALLGAGLRPVVWGVCCCVAPVWLWLQLHCEVDWNQMNVTADAIRGHQYEKFLF